MKKAIVLLVTVFALAAAALPMVSAQEETPEGFRSVTFTEARINEVFWVTNPANRHLTDVNINLQSENEGQVTVSALYSWRTGSGVRTIRLAVVLTPNIVNGRLFWHVELITADGEEASSDLVAQVNRHLSASWRRWVAGNLPDGALHNVRITDSEITFSYTPRAI